MNLKALVALAALLAAGSASAEPLVLASAQAGKIVNGNNGTRFSLDIAAVCGSQSLIVPTWCPGQAEGVIGGTFRELEAPAGRRLRFQLSNPPGTWDQPRFTARVFALVKENSPLLSGGCPRTALACATVPLGGTEVVWIGLEVGTYWYYDPSWLGSGYGIVRVVPDRPLE